MRRMLVALISLGVLIAVVSCASMKEPPSVIYPDRQENPSAYKIDPL